jgi:hypothetical protein
MKPRPCIGLVERLWRDGFAEHGKRLMDALASADERGFLGADDRVRLAGVLYEMRRCDEAEALWDALLEESDQGNLAPRTTGRMLVQFAHLHDRARAERVLRAFVGSIGSQRGNPQIWLEVMIQVHELSPALSRELVASVVAAAARGWLVGHSHVSLRLIQFLRSIGDDASADAVAVGSRLNI